MSDVAGSAPEKEDTMRWIAAFLLLAAPILVAACNAAPADLPEEPAEATVASERQQWAGTLFTGVEQYDYFHRLAEIYPSHEITASPSPRPFPLGEPLQLPATFDFDGSMREIQTFLEETDTAALLLVDDGEIRFESYWLTGGQAVQWMSMSVGKSFVSALIGIALDEGLIGSIEEPITEYVPELVGSAYDGVRIKDVLQMSSGARWNEDYSDPESDINRFIRAFGDGSSQDEFTASLVREREPGTYNYYNSTDTQALGMMMVRATGRSLAAYAEEKLWHPLGMEENAYWLTDDHGTELAAGGLQVTARDYAKLGQLYLQEGEWHGRRIVSADWVRDSVTPDAPHVMPGEGPGFNLGYGYQWWVPKSDEGEYLAIGIYNQFIYVNPERDTVIVKLSANSAYGTTPDDSSSREMESLAFFRALAAVL